MAKTSFKCKKLIKNYGKYEKMGKNLSKIVNNYQWGKNLTKIDQKSEEKVEKPIKFDQKLLKIIGKLLNIIKDVVNWVKIDLEGEKNCKKSMKIIGGN